MPFTKEELQQAIGRLSPQEKEWIDEQRAKKLALGDLGKFGEYVFGYKPAKHHQQIIDFINKNPKDNILVIAPPRHAKTTWLGVIYPTFMIAHNPGIHIVYASASEQQATKQSIEIRATIERNPSFKELVGDVFPDHERWWTKSIWQVKSPRFKSTKDPTLIVTAPGGQNILGSTADLIIMDDLNDDKNTANQDQREKVEDWVVRTLMTRQSDQARMICIMTRWHEGDLAAFFQENGFKTLVLQALGCGGADKGCDLEHYHRPFMAPLWPEVWHLDRLLEIKRPMDVWQWEGVYQGNPTPVGGTIWKEEWWRFYQTDDKAWEQKELELLPSEFNLKVQSWDTSQKTGEENDWSVCTTWGYARGNYYLLDVWRGKVEYPDLKKAVKAQYERWQPGVVLVEEKSSGADLVQELPIETSIPVVPVKVTIDKASRSRAASWAASAGRIYLPYDAPWKFVYIKEHSAFPNGRWDDQVDSTSQAITWIRQNTGEDANFGKAHDELSRVRSTWAITSADALADDDMMQEGLSRWSRFD